MAHSVSSRKRIRQNHRRRARNRWRLKTMREAIKSCEVAIAGDDAAQARETLVKACAVIDKTAARGVIHKNQAARRKSRLNARVKAKVTA